jgi:hypothetical protein
MKLKEHDIVIIGTGIYGLYAANLLAKTGKNILVIECDSESFGRGSYINQARVHNGYHYPRSISTAAKSAHYFQRFNEDFSFAINNKFRKIYALSSRFSFTNGEQFKKFCAFTNIPCQRIDASQYFQTNMIDEAFETEEFAFDAFMIRDKLIADLKNYDNVEVQYSTKIVDQKIIDEYYHLSLNTNKQIKTPFVLNTTYASVNQILNLFQFEMFKIKYEICEIALCKPNKNLDGVGLTVMDGPFFSVMPFGLDGSYSLTSVTFTPHVTSFEKLPKFKCQKNQDNDCSETFLGNCNLCDSKPKSAWGYMYQLAKQYLVADLDFHHTKSLFAIKPILLASELDDSRPTVIREYRTSPRFVSILSGKINTIYDMDEVLS